MYETGGMSHNNHHQIDAEKQKKLSKLQKIMEGSTAAGVTQIGFGNGIKPVNDDPIETSPMVLCFFFFGFNFFFIPPHRTYNEIRNK